jgi:tetratricopeptide (TPR) repeat protein
MPRAQPSTIASLLERLDEHIAIFDTIEQSLTLLHADLLREVHGQQLLFAIDFAELHAYAYGSSRLSLVAGLPHEDDISVHSRGRVALAYVFSEAFPKLVQLPPYEMELRDHLRKARAELEVVSSEVISKREKLKRVLSAKMVRGKLNDIVHAHDDGRILSAHEVRAVAAFAVEHFKEAFAWLSATETIDGIDKMLSLVRGGRFVQLAELERNTPREDMLAERGKEFHDAIVEGRGGRSFQSFIDGLAYAWVEALNSVETRSDRLIVLLTHSAFMHEGIARVSKEQGRRGPGYLRDLNYCLARLAHQAANPLETLSRVSRSLEDVARLDGVRQRLTNVRALLEEDAKHRLAQDTVDEAVAAVDEADQHVPRLRAMIEQRENRDLILGSAGIGLWSEVSESASDHTPATKVAQFVMQVITHRDAEVLEAVKKRTERLDVDISRESAAVDDSSRRLYYVARVSSRAENVQAALRGRSRTRQVVLASLPGEPPLVLSLENKHMRRLAKAFERLRGDSNRETAQHFRHTLVRLTDLQATEPTEAHFLIAYVLASVGDWESALDWLENGIGTALDKRTTYPLLRFKAAVLRRLWRPDDAIAVCEEGLELWPDDAGLLRECATSLWEQGAQAQDWGDPKVGKLLERAIKLSEQAMNGASERHLRTQVANTLAYLLAERATDVDLAKASGLITEMTRTTKRVSWPGRYHDTEGFVYLRQAEREPRIAEQRELAQRAVECFARADAQGGFSETELRIVGRHLAAARELAQHS